MLIYSLFITKWSQSIQFLMLIPWIQKKDNKNKCHQSQIYLHCPIIHECIQEVVMFLYVFASSSFLNISNINLFFLKKTALHAFNFEKKKKKGKVPKIPKQIKFIYHVKYKNSPEIVLYKGISILYVKHLFYLY